MGLDTIMVGLVGTGYAAKQRAIAFQHDPRSQLVAVAGHNSDKTAAFSQAHQIPVCEAWQALVKNPEVQLIVVSNANVGHAEIVRAALQANKHVIVEYPLAFSPQEARELIKLAQARRCLLHVEHIELLGGIHQAIQQHLAQIGPIVYGRYTTIASQIPAPQRWTYDPVSFGFPFKAALPRFNRFINLLGEVSTVCCQTRFWPSSNPDYFRACFCQAQLRFRQGAITDITYGKGEVFSKGDRTLILQGEQGMLLFENQKGTLIQDNKETSLEIRSRTGLFAQDTQMVLEHLTNGTPLYISPNTSLYALSVADAAEHSANTNTIIRLPRQASYA